MSLTKPNITQIPAFDATFEYSIDFTYIGDQFEKSKAVIKNNTTNEQVYEGYTNSWQTRFILPANSLVNSESAYNVTICVVDRDGNEGPMSDPVLFYCRSTPVFRFENISDGQRIGTSSYVVNVEYSQSEGELLNSFRCVLYSANKTVLIDSGLIYSTDKLSYTIYNMQDQETYYIEFLGETVNHMSLSTGMYRIVVSYIYPSAFSDIILVNRPHNGDVLVSSNIIAIDGVAVPDPPKYIDDKKIDLTDPGSSVTFPDGYIISSDFQLSILIENPKLYETLIEFGTSDHIVIKYMENKHNGFDEKKAYISVNVYNSKKNIYCINSDYVPIPNYETQRLHFTLKRIGILFDSKLSVLEK